MQALLDEFKAMAITSMGESGQTGVVLAKPPDQGGKLGRPIQLYANLYKLRFKQSPAIAHYDVTITLVREEGAPPGPQTLNREVTNQIWDALVESSPPSLKNALSSAGFDCRKNVFALGKLFPQGSKSFTVELPAETPTRPPRKFEVKLQLAQLLDSSVLEKFCAHKQAANMQDAAATAIMALDVLIRHSSFRRKEFVVGAQGRKFLDTRASTALGEGAHVLAGLFQSIRPTASGMVVNLDTAFSPYIITGQLRHVCNAIVGRGAAAQPAGRGGFRGGRGGGRGGFGGGGGRPDTGPYSAQELHELKKKLVGAKVRVTHREDSRPFMIKGFGQPAGTHVVSIGEKGKKGPKPTAKEAAEAAAKGKKIPLKGEKTAGQTVTVAEYFKRTYNMNVDKTIQCVELRGGQFVPIECLELLHGASIPPTKLTANQAASMIQVAAKPPAERRTAIEALRRDADFGPGRILPPPRVQYDPKSKVPTPNVAFGAWNLKDSKFFQPGKPLQHWAIAVFASERDASRQGVQQFFNTLTAQARLRGMNFNPKPSGGGITYWDGREDKLAVLKRAANFVLAGNPNNPATPTQQPPQMIFCILKDPKMYDEVKKKAAFDLPIAVPTQVMLTKKILDQRGVDQYCGNLLLKVNAKVGGINSGFANPKVDLPGFALNKTLMLGADVTHPTGLGTARRGEREVPPSIAAVVASTDPQGM
ncbi:hypothetical protein JCM11641_004138 [Rhodosporidiobolus odoratus]